MEMRDKGREAGKVKKFLSRPYFNLETKGESQISLLSQVHKMMCLYLAIVVP